MAAFNSSMIVPSQHADTPVSASLVFTIPSNLSHIFSFKLGSYSSLDTTKDYWFMENIEYYNTSNSIKSIFAADPGYKTYFGTKTVSYNGVTYYPGSRFRYEIQNDGSKKLILELTDNGKCDYMFGAVNYIESTFNQLKMRSHDVSATPYIMTYGDILKVNSGYSATIPATILNPDGVFWSGSFQNRGASINGSITFPTAYKSVSTTKTLSFPSKEYYSFKSGINDLVKNNFSFQYTSGGSTTTLNSSYITVSDVSGSQYNKAVTITQTVTNPVSTINTDFANGILVPNTGVKLSTFYNTVAYNMASLNVAVTLTKSGNTFTVNSLPDPIWQYISSFALNVPVQAGGFSGTCTAFAQTGPFVNNYTVSYSGTITTWNQSVTSSMNQVCSISYSYQVSGNNTSSSKTFTVDRYYGYITSSTHLRMGVNFTGSSSLSYQSTAPTVEQLSSTSEIRSVTRI